MPLVWCTVFFVVLFAFEWLGHMARLSENELALKRYQAVEHPHRRTSDRYVDALG